MAFLNRFWNAEKFCCHINLNVKLPSRVDPANAARQDYSGSPLPIRGLEIELYCGQITGSGRMIWSRCDYDLAGRFIWHEVGCVATNVSNF